MKLIWNRIDRKNWTMEKKYRSIILLPSILSALSGFALWLIIQRWALSTPDWMICFIGYPVLISWIRIFLYSCSHKFHSQGPSGTAV